jgi:hypothetical protein
MTLARRVRRIFQPLATISAWRASRRGRRCRCKVVRSSSHILILLRVEVPFGICRQDVHRINRDVLVLKCRARLRFRVERGLNLNAVDSYAIPVLESSIKHRSYPSREMVRTGVERSS